LDGGEVNAAALQIHERIREQLISIFRGGIEKGLFVDVPPVTLVMALEGVSNGFWTELIRQPDAFSEADVARLRKRLFFDAVRVKPRIRLSTGAA
jgi:hypothetical protein